MTVGTLVYGVVPVLVDFGESHVANADWVPDARMHTVWLLAVMSSLAAASLYFLWLFEGDRVLGLRIAGLVGLCVYGGFFASAAFSPT